MTATARMVRRTDGMTPHPTTVLIMGITRAATRRDPLNPVDLDWLWGIPIDQILAEIDGVYYRIVPNTTLSTGTMYLFTQPEFD